MPSSLGPSGVFVTNSVPPRCIEAHPFIVQSDFLVWTRLELPAKLGLPLSYTTDDKLMQYMAECTLTSRPKESYNHTVAIFGLDYNPKSPTFATSPNDIRGVVLFRRDDGRDLDGKHLHVLKMFVCSTLRAAQKQTTTKDKGKGTMKAAQKQLKDGIAKLTAENFRAFFGPYVEQRRRTHRGWETVRFPDKSGPPFCSLCMRYFPEGGLIGRCTKCNMATYCTKKCHDDDWPEHEKTCGLTWQEAYDKNFHSDYAGVTGAAIGMIEYIIDDDVDRENIGVVIKREESSDDVKREKVLASSDSELSELMMEVDELPWNG